VITQNLDASRGKRSDGSGHWLSVIPETLQINYQPKQLTKIELKKFKLPEVSCKTGFQA
jgi:hypothetical protein